VQVSILLYNILGIKRFIDDNVDRRICQLNDALTECLLDATNDKRVLLDLSGGHDTRVNLSILLGNDVDFVAYTRAASKDDTAIAGRIAKFYGFSHVIKKADMDKKSFYDDFDVHVSGIGYTELLCGLYGLNRSFNQIVDMVKRLHNPSRFSPILERRCIDIVKRIPIVFLAGGIIQKRLIELNKPDLLRFPFTFYDFRHWFMNRYYVFFAGFLFRSYYSGTGRNLYDRKDIKDVYLFEEDTFNKNSLENTIERKTSK
jgi:hypothetical protein